MQNIYHSSKNLAKGTHDFSSHDVQGGAVNGTPSNAHATLSHITELGTANGYTAGGATTTIGGTTQSGGTLTITATDPAAWTASGAGIAFRYAALYNDTSA